MNEETLIAWAAGFLDGEGCFHLQKRNDVRDVSSREASISASQRKREPLDKLQEILGGKVHECLQDGRPVYRWVLTNAPLIREACLKLIPHLCNKKLEAMIVASYCSTVYKRGRIKSIPEHEYVERMQIIQQYEEVRGH